MKQIAVKKIRGYGRSPPPLFKMNKSGNIRYIMAGIKEEFLTSAQNEQKSV